MTATMVLWLFLLVNPDAPMVVMGAGTEQFCNEIRTSVLTQNAARPIQLQFTASECVPLNVSRPEGA